MWSLVVRLSFVALSFAMGGCSDDFDDLPPCQKKAIACKNNCFKSGAGSACVGCCDEARDACMKGENHSFFWCPNKE
ncbi:hypothetical protein [Polyangium mundeleinium]|uniref:Lipoprotein n=1 Tax=Polyangium mundeleinium TaxID=2995306 RepID=A0ABT5EGS2_9BACT|nr:hypothetical protein [Polyangium mundeleinium]MDC0741030.1 hypothetical protein [Polyangium mundeleinium]